jgi:two-component system, LytTR family, sensor kinase
MVDARSAERGVRWPWIAAVWAAGALIEASQTILVMHAEGKHEPWLPLFVTEFAIWIPWALATPSIVGLARRYPIVRDASVRTITVHLAALAILSVVTEAWSAWLQVLFNPWGNRRWPTFVDTFRTTLVFQAFMFLVVYALILTVTHLADARERIARQATESARLAEELATAQLAALRGQIEPHFIYNTLNAVTGLVRDRRNDEALSMIVGLSEFLRRASEDSHRAQVTLGEEVDYLQRYLQIQQVRFGERLRTRLDIPPDLLRAMVPNLLLQPLAENAIKHGIARRVAGGTVAVSAARQDGDLLITIQNDGPARSVDPDVNPEVDSQRDADATHGGVGIANLRSRLKILHGDRSALQLRHADAGGTEVLVRLPFIEA